MNPLYLIDSLILTLSLGLYVLFHQPATIVPILLTLLTYRFLRSQALWQKGFSLASFLALIIGWWSDRYSLAMLAATLTGVTGLSLVLSHVLKNGRAPQTVWSKVRRGLASLALLGLAVGHLFLTYNVINPDFITSHTNVFFGLVTVPEKEASTTINSDGTVYYRDLTYPSSLGNNKLDIYTRPEAKGTIFYIHGGGYAGDDKFYREDYLFRYVKDGYNVVNVNYLLAPQAHYGNGLKQVDDAMHYILEEADTYGIDPKTIIFSGDSAGGHLTAQYAMTLTNPSYAQKIGFIPKSQVIPKAYIGVSSWSDIQMGLETGWTIFDWFIQPLARSYFQVLDVEQAAIAEEASIVKHVDANFPASFISDGNTGSFTTANLALVDRLKALGVTVDSQFYDKSEAELGHIFELSLDNPYAQEVYAKHLAFLEKILAD